MSSVRASDVVVLLGGVKLRTQLLSHLCSRRGVSLIPFDATGDGTVQDLAPRGARIRAVLVDAACEPPPAVLRQVTEAQLPLLGLLDSGQALLDGSADVAGWLDVDADPDDFVAALRNGSGAAAPPSAPGGWALDSLTPRELEVLGEMLTGDSTGAMARRLGISEHTVRTHIHNLLGKLGVRSRAQAAVVALEAGLETPKRAVSA